MDNSKNKQLISQLKPLVNNPKLLNSFNDYLDLQIMNQYKLLGQADNTVMIHRAQGAVAILNRLKLLRDEVNGSS